jgi:hypothetical protein
VLDVEVDVLGHGAAPRVVEPCDPVVEGHARAAVPFGVGRAPHERTGDSGEVSRISRKLQVVTCAASARPAHEKRLPSGGKAEQVTSCNLPQEAVANLAVPMDPKALEEAALAAAAEAASEDEIERVRVEYLGRKSELKLALREVRGRSAIRRPRCSSPYPPF